jgi:hypothetical protein
MVSTIVPLSKTALCYFKAGHTVDIAYEDGKIIITKSKVQRFKEL